MDIAATSPLKAVQSFKARKKFAASAWKKRGLLPSSAEVCEQLETFFNELAVDQSIVLKTDGSESDLRQTLISKLQSLSSSDYDTEEREFICDEFALLAKALNLGSITEFDDWLYGSEIDGTDNPRTEPQPEPRLAKHLQDCTACGTALITNISELRADIDFRGMAIIKCLACGGLNLLHLPVGVYRFNPVSYDCVELLRGTEGTSRLHFQKAYEAQQKHVVKKNTRLDSRLAGNAAPVRRYSTRPQSI